MDNEDERRRYGRALLIFFLGLSLWYGLKAANQFFSRNKPHTKEQAELLLGFTLPSWGLLERYVDAKGFDVAGYIRFRDALAIFLLVSETKRLLPLEQMLNDLEAIDSQRYNESTTRLKWPRLMPQVSGTTTLSLKTGKIEAATVVFPAIKREPAKGVLLHLNKHGRAITVLAFSKKFKKRAIEDFINQFEKESRRLDSKDYAARISVSRDTYKTYYRSGRLHWEAGYKNGLWDGIGKEYYKNGVLKQEGHFVGGQREGATKEYYETGPLRVEWNYEKGKLQGIAKEYYPTGRLRAEWFHQDNKVSGLYKNYYPGGALRCERNFKEGRLEGVSKQYYENGNPASEENFSQNKLEGPRKQYDEEGSLVSEGDCQAGYCAVKEYYKGGALKAEYHLRQILPPQGGYGYTTEIEGDYKEYDPEGRLKEESDKPSEITERAKKVEEFLEEHRA